LGLENNLELEKVQYLPPSLKELLIDKRAIVAFDFARLPRLRVLSICNGIVEKEELKNLPKLEKFESNF
jgi:hypothetical protein